MRRAILALVSFVSLLLAIPAMAAAPSDLHGRWTGTWFVDEWFVASTGEPIADPPLEDIGIDLVLHGFDGQDYGELTLYANLEIINTGIVKSISVDTSNVVSILIEYPDLGLGYPAGEISGLLSGKVITGDFDEFQVPVENLIAFKGPMIISAVPESAAWAMWAAGLGGLAILMRRRRDDPQADLQGSPNRRRM